MTRVLKFKGSSKRLWEPGFNGRTWTPMNVKGFFLFQPPEDPSPFKGPCPKGKIGNGLKKKRCPSLFGTLGPPPLGF